MANDLSRLGTAYVRARLRAIPPDRRDTADRASVTKTLSLE
jgi:hypothetical protein